MASIIRHDLKGPVMKLEHDLRGHVVKLAHFKRVHRGQYWLPIASYTSNTLFDMVLYAAYLLFYKFMF